MGTLVGHVAPGFAFFAIGLWHLLNHIKLHFQHPKTYKSLPWFPTSKSRYLELFTIMAACAASISMELFIGPEKHQPLDEDGTIPSYHLHNFEHSNISLTFFIYALFAIALDKTRASVSARYGLTLMLGAIAFAQQLLLFHLHSADHMGIEGQYHWLLQLVIFVSLLTTLLGVGYPRSFLNSFMRSFSVMFQGVWLMVMGFMLWTPGLIPKGCFLNLEGGHQVVRCRDSEAMERAKSLVNIEFSWYLIGVTIFVMSLYMGLSKMFPPEEKVEYQSLSKFEEDDDVEAQKSHKLDHPRSFLPVGGSLAPQDIER